MRVLVNVIFGWFATSRNSFVLATAAQPPCCMPAVISWQRARCEVRSLARDEYCQKIARALSSAVERLRKAEWVKRSAKT